MSESVSVIIPFFNDSGTVCRALDSVLAQSEPPCEVIVSDDGSLPSEFETLRNIAESREVSAGVPIKILHSTHNRGPASARNVGWDTAKGSWVAFLDADDSWVSDKLARQLEVARKAPHVSLMASLGARSSEDADVMSQHTPFVMPTVNSVGSVRLLFGNPLITSGVMVRRGISFRFDERMRFAEDYDLWLRIVRSNGAAVILQEAHVVSYKRAFGDSGLSANLWGMQFGALRAILRATLPPSPVSLVIPISIAYSMLRFARRVVLTRWTKNDRWSSSTS